MSTNLTVCCHSYNATKCQVTWRTIQCGHLVINDINAWNYIQVIWKLQPYHKNDYMAENVRCNNWWRSEWWQIEGKRKWSDCIITDISVKSSQQENATRAKISNLNRRRLTAYKKACLACFPLLISKPSTCLRLGRPAASCWIKLLASSATGLPFIWMCCKDDGSALTSMTVILFDSKFKPTRCCMSFSPTICTWLSLRVLNRKYIRKSRYPWLRCTLLQSSFWTYSQTITPPSYAMRMQRIFLHTSKPWNLIVGVHFQFCEVHQCANYSRPLPWNKLLSKAVVPIVAIRCLSLEHQPS